MNNIEKVQLFQKVFKVREDVYGLSYLRNGTDWTGLSVAEPLTEKEYLNHLIGRSLKSNYSFPQILGGYVVNKDNTCNIGIIDIDKDYLPFVEEYLEITNKMELPVYIECSKQKGYHLWHFFEYPVSAGQARNFLLGIVKSAGLPEETEVFPKQTSVSSGKGLGNYINLPLNGKFVPDKRMVFLNPDNIFKPYDDQWQFLSEIKYISSDYLQGIDSKPTQVDIEVDNVEKQKCSELLAKGSGAGGRRPAMAKMGGYLINRVDKDVFMSIMSNWNQVHNNPPLPTMDLERQVQNLYNTYGKKTEQTVNMQQPDSFLVNHIIMADQYKSYIEKLQGLRIKLGIPEFDNEMRGLCPGEVLILQARPNCGKTIWAQSLMYTVWERQKLPSLMFSLEMSVEQLYERGASMITELPCSEIEKRFLEGDIDYILNKCNVYENVMFTDITGIGVSDMRTIIENMPIRPALVVIDYLTLIKPSKGLSTYETTSAISKDLQTLAKDTNTAIVCLSQLHRGPKEDDEVAMADGRNSGAIEEDAFFILGLWKDREDIDKRIIRLLKNKRGATGATAYLQFTNESPRLYPIDTAFSK